MERAVPSLETAPRLATRPGLRLLSYLALLPASAVELEAAVDRAVTENPLLERLPWHRCPTCGLATGADRCPACRTARWGEEPTSADDWRDTLLREAALELRAHLHPGLRLVAAALDEHGLLRAPPDLAPEDLQTVVRALRLVGPPGIAATSALDCVRVQAHELVRAGTAPPLVAEIAAHWLPEVAEERYPEIAAGTGAEERAVREAVQVLRERTRPFVALTGDSVRTAPTDVVFTPPPADAGPSAPPRAYVAGPAAAGVGPALDVLPDAPEARAWAAPHRAAADRLLAAIGARSRMLQRVADELAVRQRGFLLDGPLHHAPLRRTDVATALGVHPSTVGRAVDGKVARCPDGRILPLAALFGAGPSTRHRVAAALAAHPAAGDREVAELLSRAGAPIARRTVAKYRALLANPASPPR